MKRILFSFMLAITACLSASAQMTEDKIVQYIAEQQAKGVSQEQIVYDLSKKGVTVKQLQQMREKYDKRQSSGIMGNTVNAGNETQGRSRDRQTLNTMPGYDYDNITQYGQQTSMTEKERLQVMYDQSMFLFTDSIELLRQQLLPKKKEIYGHSVFNSEELSFQPSANLPTPQNYRLGAGDEVIIDIWGESQTSFQETISPDGNIVVEGVGPVFLSGLTVSEADSRLKNVFSEIYSGSSIKLSLGQNRSIQVNVLGEVMKPGTYAMSSFGTVFNALYLAGGVSDLGSMRDVKVYRSNRLVATVDLYDYILNGKMEGDVRLEDNDVVIVAPHTILVNIDGRIRRPMLYEMKETESLANLIDYAGGLESDAYRKDVRVTRMGDFQRQIFTVSKDSQSGFMLMDGDSIYVDSIQVTYSNMAEVRGAVFRPGMFQIGEGINTVKQLLDAAGGLKEDAFPTRALLSRTNPDKTLTNLSLNIKGLSDGTQADVELRNNDILFIPSLFDVGEVKTFSIFGEVMFPGDYKFADNTGIEDLILQAGGLKEAASVSKIEVVRKRNDKSATSKSDQLSESFTFSVNEDLSIQDNQFVLQPYDVVYIRRSPGFTKGDQVVVEGEVLFPGYYSLSSSADRLSDVIARAGGFSPTSYPEGARLERIMTDDEKLRMKDLTKMLSDNDSLALASVDLTTTFYVGINLEAALDEPGSDADVILRDGDRIIVPTFNNTVKMNGEVMYSNTVPYISGKTLNYYIDRAGGYSQKAKKNKAYIVYMNGSVDKARRNSSKQIQPGCEIIVPAKQKREGMTASEILSLSSTSASLATVVLALINLLK